MRLTLVEGDVRRVVEGEVQVLEHLGEPERLGVVEVLDVWDCSH
jgi:hypothetical protein